MKTQRSGMVGQVEHLHPVGELRPFAKRRASRQVARLSRLKVAIFIDNFSATGVVINAIAIASRLSSRGCRVQLIASQARGALIDSVPKGVEVFALLPSTGGESSRRGRLRRSVFAFQRRLKAFALRAVT